MFSKKSLLFGLGMGAILPLATVVSCGSGMQRVSINIENKSNKVIYSQDKSSKTKSYKVTIENFWNGVETHPVAPAFNPHFSNIFWSTANNSNLYWENNKKASEPFKQQVETGKTTLLEQTINLTTNPAVGKSGVLVDSLPLGYKNRDILNIPYISEDFSWLNLTSSFGPDVDWFWGLTSTKDDGTIVTGINLKNPETGFWVKQQIFNIELWSAGTKDPRYTKETGPVDEQNLISRPDEMNQSTQGNNSYGLVIIEAI